jgi:hypothetical protein
VPADGIPVADSTASASILEMDVGGCTYFEAGGALSDSSAFLYGAA